MLINSDKQRVEWQPWHRRSSPTMSGNFIVGGGSKRGRKPKWKPGLRKHKQQYSFAKHNSSYKFN